MKKFIIFIVGLILLAGCQDAWDATTAGRRQQAVRSQRLADERQRIVLEKFETLYAEAKKNNNTELCAKILETYTKYLSQNQPSLSSKEYDSGQQWLQHQQTMDQLRQMEHNASFDRMMRGGLP